MRTWLLISLLITSGCYARFNSEAVSAVIHDFDFNGVVLVAQKNRVLYQKSFGYADYAKKQRFSGHEAFYLASVSKQFTAVAIAMLVEQGKLSFNSEVGPWFKDIPLLANGIKVKHLLEHTSGLPDYYGIIRVPAGFNNQGVLRLLRTQQKLNYAPGEKHEYSNSNYIVLAEIIARISGQSFSSFLEQKIVRPLGLKNTFARDKPRQRLMAQRHNEQMRIMPYAFYTVGAGGIYSNAADLRRFNLALLNNRLISAKSRQILWQPRVISKHDVPYGYGFYVLPEQNIIYHDGNLSGAHTMNWLSPQKGLMIIILSNKRTKSVRAMTEKIAKILTK